MVGVKRLTVAMTVAVIALALYLVRKSNRIERAMKPSIHLIAASAP
jgi:hypothetical protein